MKILFAIKSMSAIRGGAERVLADITARLADKGHDVTILSYDEPGQKPVYPISDKVNRVYLPIGNANNRATLRETLSRGKALRKTITAEQPDIAIGFMHSVFIPLSFALIGTKIPVIASEHIVPAHYKKRISQFILLLISTLFIKSMTVLSPRVKKQYPFFIRHKMVVMPNPVIGLKRIEDKKQARRKTKIILTVGRLDEQKNHKMLIRAFAKIALDFPDWNIRIIGEGPLYRYLKNLITGFNLEDRIILAGTTDNINAEYTAADIFSMPSRYESFGLATAEAMAHGLPCIGLSDCPGTNELITNEINGLLVDGPDRNIAYANGLRRLIESKDLRQKLGQAAPEKIQEFDADVIAQNWEDLITQSIKGTA